MSGEIGSGRRTGGMTYRRVLGAAAFSMTLFVWPLALYEADKHHWAVIDTLAFGSLIFFIGCAIELRSLTIAGAVLGYLSQFLPGRPANVESIVGPPLIGAITGFLCQAALGPRKLTDSNRSERLIWRAALVIYLVILAVLAAFSPPISCYRW
jgi:hypothetical protein